MLLKNTLASVRLFCLVLCALQFVNGQNVLALDKENHEGLHLELTSKLKAYCEKIDTSFKKYRWAKSECESFSWYHIRDSVLGDPLTWTIFGEIGADHDKDGLAKKDVTMVMCGVHGDEITPIKFCFDLMYYLRDSLQDPEFKKSFENKVVLIAPLVNPDSYFKRRPTRTNARGVDVNRNFPTEDWFKEAQKMWVSKYRRDKRRNPGKSPGSEPELVFQMNLIKRYNPDKIISVHSPLSILDYDGPSLATGISPSDNVDPNKAQELLIQMSKDASDYRIENYPFFPGSLGNWAGQERSIPTYTLELPTSNPAKSKEYWALFKASMHKAVFHDIRTFVDGHTSQNQKKLDEAEKKLESYAPVNLPSNEPIGQMP